ncbi:hypothetical protein D3C77_781740 [compost metagenome]
MEADDLHHDDGEYIAEKQAVDRLADDCRILAHIEHEDHHQFAGKKDRGAG